MADEERGRTRYVMPVEAQSPFRDGSPFEDEYTSSRGQNTSLVLPSVGSNVRDRQRGDWPILQPSVAEDTRASRVCCDECRNTRSEVR